MKILNTKEIDNLLNNYSPKVKKIIKRFKKESDVDLTKMVKYHNGHYYFSDTDRKVSGRLINLTHSTSFAITNDVEELKSIFGPVLLNIYKKSTDRYGSEWHSFNGRKNIDNIKFTNLKFIK